MTSTSLALTPKHRSSRTPPIVEKDDLDDRWEQLADLFVSEDRHPVRYSQLLSVCRIALPSLLAAFVAANVYTPLSLFIAELIHDDKVFEVVSQDLSQFIQNILTTSGLVFSLLVGQTFYFMYQQQEAIYIALFNEVTVAKSLLEQVALVCQGRPVLYHNILDCIEEYVLDDLAKFNDMEPSELVSRRPDQDPLQDILYLTSVGEPSIIYDTVKELRSARADRLGALQRKLPPIHTVVLYTLAAIVLFTFPLLGAGSQTIGGNAILRTQSVYISFIVFGMGIIMGVISELQNPGRTGAYNARNTLRVMILGLEEELTARLEGKFVTNMEGPSIDADYFDSPVTMGLDGAFPPE